MKKSRLMSLIAVGLAAVTLTSCGETGVDGSKLFVLTYSNADPNMSGLWYPGFEAAKNTYGFNTISWNDADSKDDKGLQFLDQAIADGSYPGYALNVVSQENGKSYLEKVKNEGKDKPVVFWNREILNSDKTVDADTMKSYPNAYYVGIESAEGGRYEGKLAADYIIAQGKNEDGTWKADLNKDGKIGFAVILGEQGHADAEARTTWAPIYMNAYLQAYVDGTYDPTDSSKTISDSEINSKYGKNATGHTRSASWPTEIQNGTEQVKGAFGSGDASIIIGVSTATSWDGESASTKLESLITGNQGQLDMVLSNNDGMAITIAKQPNFKASKAKIVGIDALADAITQIETNDQYIGTIKNDGKTQAKVVLDVERKLIGTKGEDGKFTGQADPTKASELGGLKVVQTKDEWSANATSVWYESDVKAFRVHHAIVTKDNVAQYK